MVVTLERRLRALVAAVVFTGGTALPIVAATHQVFDDDAACGDVVFATTSASPQFAPPGAVRIAGHCAICHWLRTASGARAAVAPSGDTWFQSAELAAVRPGHWVGAAAPIDRPSRAPPTVL